LLARWKKETEKGGEKYEKRTKERGKIKRKQEVKE
jgi:hypothetical protein